MCSVIAKLGSALGNNQHSRLGCGGGQFLEEVHGEHLTLCAAVGRVAILAQGSGSLCPASWMCPSWPDAAPLGPQTPKVQAPRSPRLGVGGPNRPRVYPRNRL